MPNPVGGPVERHVDQVSDGLVEEDALEVLPVSAILVQLVPREPAVDLDQISSL